MVIGVAKRARRIAEEAEESGEVMLDKPVQRAVEQFARGEYVLIEQEDIGKEIE